MKFYTLLLVLSCAQVFATETETSTVEPKTTEAQVARLEEQLERVKLDTIKVTPQERMPASWGGGGRNFR